MAPGTETPKRRHSRALMEPPRLDGALHPELAGLRTTLGGAGQCQGLCPRCPGGLHRGWVLKHPWGCARGATVALLHPLLGAGTGQGRACARV